MLNANLVLIRSFRGEFHNPCLLLDTLHRALCHAIGSRVASWAVLQDGFASSQISDSIQEASDGWFTVTSKDDLAS